MRKEGYYWVYLFSPKNFSHEGWEVSRWDGISFWYNNQPYSEDCFKEINEQMIVNETSNNTKHQFLDIANKLNQEMYEKYGEIAEQFYYNTNGNIDMFGFGDTMLWCSEDDDREWIEDKNDYEDFEPFIVKLFNKWTNYIGELNL